MIQYDSISIKIVMYLMTQNPPQPRLPSSFIAPANLQLGSLAQFDGQCVSHLRLERFFGFTSFSGCLVDADATPNLVRLGALVPGSKASFQGGIASRAPGKRLVRNLTKKMLKNLVNSCMDKQIDPKKNSDLFNSINQISRQQTMYAAHKGQHIVYWRFTFPRFCEAREDHCVFAMSRSQILTSRS